MSKKISTLLVLMAFISTSCSSYHKESIKAQEQEGDSWPGKNSNLWRIPERGIR